MSEHTTTKKSSKKVVLIVTGSILAVILIAVIAVSILVSNMSKNMGSYVEVTYPEREDINASVTASGIITSGDITTYTTSVNATVNEINIKPGQAVQSGDILLTFDTTDLEEQYNQASLNARSNQLSNQSTVETSNRTSQDLEQAKRNVASLKTQIAQVEAEIAELQNGSVSEDPNSDVAASLAEKRSRLATVLDEIQIMIEATDSAALATDPDYISKCNERDTLEASISNLESILSNMPGESNTIASALSAKSSELADLQSQLAQQESLVSSAETGVLTATQREQLSISNQLANLQVEAAATSLEEGKAGIVADRDGIITSVDITRGAVTGSGMPLFTIASTDNIKVTVQLSKTDLETVAIGQSATVTLLNQEYEGKVTYISRMATTTASGATNIEAEVTLQNTDANIVLGLDAKVVIHTASVTDVLTIPNLAVNVDMNGTFVYAIEDGVIVKKYIQTGVSDVTDCEILEGINEDTAVITNITSDIQEGMPAIPYPTEQADTATDK